MKKTIKMAALAAVALSLATGCETVHNVEGADTYNEGRVVVPRPREITLLKSTSLARYLEVVYGQSSENAVGQLVVQVGLRNKGPTQWFNWFSDAPDSLNVHVTCNFYDREDGARMGAPIIYSTDMRAITLPRGQTIPYAATCPFPGAKDFQLIIGE